MLGSIWGCCQILIFFFSVLSKNTLINFDCPWNSRRDKVPNHRFQTGVCVCDIWCSSQSVFVWFTNFFFHKKMWHFVVPMRKTAYLSKIRINYYELIILMVISSVRNAYILHIRRLHINHSQGVKLWIHKVTKCFFVCKTNVHRL